MGAHYTKGCRHRSAKAQVLTLGAYGDGMDFFTLKGTVEAVLKSLRAKDVRFEPCAEDPSYHPGGR